MYSAKCKKVIQFEQERLTAGNGNSLQKHAGNEQMLVPTAG